MRDVHGVAALPDSRRLRRTGRVGPTRRVPRYFADYERDARPPRAAAGAGGPGDRATASSSSSAPATAPGPTPHAGQRDRDLDAAVRARTTRACETFAGEQLHTVDYPGAEHFRGRRVLVVGGGASAVQFLGELAPVTDTLWVTRRPPVWRSDEFDREAGHEAVALVEERVRRGLPPASVVSVTGLALRDAGAAGRVARRLRPPTDVRAHRAGRRALGRRQLRAGRRDPAGPPASGRPSSHLAPLHLRSRHGGIQLERDGTTARGRPAGPAGRLRPLGEHDRRQPGRTGGGDQRAPAPRRKAAA